MKIKPRINEYRHQVLDCPFCDGWVYLRESTKVSPDPLRDLKRHITTQAKNEAFAFYLNNHLEWALAEENIKIPHLEYYQDHTALKAQRDGSKKRQYDNDLTL